MSSDDNNQDNEDKDKKDNSKKPSLDILIFFGSNKKDPNDKDPNPPS